MSMSTINFPSSTHSTYNEPLTLSQLARRAQMAQQALDDAVEIAVKRGETFTSIAMSLECTEAAVRSKAKRKGWYSPGSRLLPNLKH